MCSSVQHVPQIGQHPKTESQLNLYKNVWSKEKAEHDEEFLSRAHTCTLTKLTVTLVPEATTEGVKDNTKGECMTETGW
jgi:hypothetical protein